MKKEMTGSEAIYGFCGWLTTRKEKIVMSSKHDAAPIADLIEQFCNINELNEPRNNWSDYLVHPQ